MIGDQTAGLGRLFGLRFSPSVRANTTARDVFIHSFDSKLTAVRMGPWKFHFAN